MVRGRSLMQHNGNTLRKGEWRVLINKTVLFVSEAACVLGCSSRQIYHLIHTGQLRAYKDEGAWAWKIRKKPLCPILQLV